MSKFDEFVFEYKVREPFVAGYTLINYEDEEFTTYENFDEIPNDHKKIFIEVKDE